MAPRVLIADKLSPAAIDIFKARGVEADVKTGLSKDELLKIMATTTAWPSAPPPRPTRTSSPPPRR